MARIVNASDRSLSSANYKPAMPSGAQLAQADLTGPAGSLSVPEPSSGVGIILLVSLAGFARPRRRGH